MTDHIFQSGDRIGWPRTGVNYDLLCVYGNYGWACPDNDKASPITLDLTHEGLVLIDRRPLAAEADNSDVTWGSATEGSMLAFSITASPQQDVWTDFISPEAHARTIATLINLINKENRS